jgi:phenylpyruvate tautomerase PptA (4-oxalocrotonate tautomerase family)
MNALPVPFYGQGHAHLTVHSPEELLDESAREKLAEETTRIHCDATGIPRSYGNVMFTDMPAGRYFVAGKPSGHSVLSGAILAVGEPGGKRDGRRLGLPGNQPGIAVAG